MTCVFCEIAKKKIPAEVLYEDASAVAFLDREPRAPGHTMVIPKTHTLTILDVAEKDTGPLFSAVKKVAKSLTEALGAEGLTIGINHGRAAGQAVEHLHIHLIPRFHGDGGTSLHGIVHNPPRESLKEIAEKIRRASHD